MHQHSEDGHWWVILTGPKDRFPIGYWPKNIFTSLADVANQVEWGGEAGNPERKWPYADMGNSLKASYDTTESAYFRHVTVDTESTKFVEPQGTKKVFDCPIFYTVLDAGHKGDFWGRLMFYGGYH
ncbi:DNA double-strand break repair protein Mre11 [Bienertia sinuspersici]